MTRIFDKDIDAEKTLPFPDAEKDIAAYCAYRIERAKNDGSRERNLAIDRFMRKENPTSESDTPPDNSGDDDDAPSSNKIFESKSPEDISEDHMKRGISLYDCADAKEQLNGNLPGSENCLSEWLIRLSEKSNSYFPFVRATHESISRLETICSEFPNFRSASEVLIGAARLSNIHELPLQFPNLLLDGPPGIGKTEWIRQCADALGLPLAIIPLGSIHQTFEIAGGHRSYRGTEPGLLVKALMQHRVANLLFLFDEAELAPTEIHQPLYSFIEDDRYEDRFLELKFNVKHINTVFITNNRFDLPAPIRSRVWELLIPEPTHDQKLSIVNNIYRSIRSSNCSYFAFDENLDDQSRERIAAHSLRQARITLEVAMLRSCARTKEQEKLFIRQECIPVVDTKQPFGFI